MPSNLTAPPNHPVVNAPGSRCNLGMHGQTATVPERSLLRAVQRLSGRMRTISSACCRSLG